MRHYDTYSHRFGLEVVQGKSSLEEVLDILEEPSIKIEKHSATKINEYAKEALSLRGWALKTKVHSAFNVDINASKDCVGLMIQTGNITRAFYDLMKFQALHLNNRIEAGILILPSGSAATCLGSNIANFVRVTNELEMFKHVITVPCLILSFGS